MTLEQCKKHIGQKASIITGGVGGPAVTIEAVTPKRVRVSRSRQTNKLWFDGRTETVIELVRPENLNIWDEQKEEYIY